MTDAMQFVTPPRVGLGPPKIKTAMGLVGFTAVLGQIVLMREAIVVFNGNEVSLGTMLATWLLWTAVGSAVASRLKFARERTRVAVVITECAAGLSLLPTIWFLRISRSYFQTVPGELVGPLPMLVTSWICFSMFCFLSGCLFVVIAHLFQRECAVSGHVAATSAYLFEAAGSGLGGILASILLLRVFDSFQIAVLIAGINLCMAATLFFFSAGRWLAISTATAVLTLLALLYLAPSLSAAATRRQWQGLHVLDSRNSIYGNITVTETGPLRSIYDNGIIAADAPDENAAEEAIHYALLEHTSPGKVLLIGGGINGGIAQALKHPTVKSLDYVELDPLLIKMAQQFFLGQVGLTVPDSRVRLHYLDGRRFLQTSPVHFDLIILNLPQPSTAQLNRFYSEEFFATARNHLAGGGVFAMQLQASEEYISPGLAEFLRCIHKTLRQVFPYIVVIPGETMHFVASTQAGSITDDPQVLISRLRERRLETRYVQDYFIPFRMTPDRMAQVHDLLRPLPETRVNRDFEPIAYYFNILLWTAQFNPHYAQIFREAADMDYAFIICSLLTVFLLIAALILYGLPLDKRQRSSVGCCVVATGFTLITLQIVLLLAFQCIYGYVYHQLAIVISLFMAGLAIGSWLGSRRLRDENAPRFRALAVTQMLIASATPMLMLLIALLMRATSTIATGAVAQVTFPALAAAGGILGGYQFPIATEIYLDERLGERRLGVIYAMDLLGGCVGALLLSTYVIPVFGFWKTAWLTAALNLAPAVLAIRLARESKTVPA